MKITELFESSNDFTDVIKQLEQTDTYKQFIKKFDITSTPRQIKNGTLEVVSRPDVIKLPREFIISKSGIKVRNKGTSIWADTGFTPKGYVVRDFGTVEWFEKALQFIGVHFYEWLDKRIKTATKDASNINLTSLQQLDQSKYKKPLTDFSCSHNHLTSLEGLPPLLPSASLIAGSNELVSPLKGLPDELHHLNLNNNKLTTFEGLPKKVHGLHLGRNPIKSFKELPLHVKECSILTLPHVKTGILSVFKVKGLQKLQMENAHDNEEVRNLCLIVNKHLEGNRDILQCQEDLIDAGLQEYARL